MTVASYQDTAARWCNVVLGRTTKPTLTNRRMPTRGDSIFSYGTHFEIARLIRDRKGEPLFFLLNGETFSNTTTKHQAEVRGAISRTSMPSVIIPHRALEAAGIDFASIQLIDVQSDWWEQVVTVRQEFPTEAEWQYESDTLTDYGGWRNSRTGEIHLRLKAWGEMPPKQETCEVCVKPVPYPRVDYTAPFNERQAMYAEYERLEVERKAHIRARHGEWDEFSAHRRATGRRFIQNKRGWRTWDMEDDGNGGIEYVQTFDRHRLGASLIRAQVRFMARRRCPREVAPYVEEFEGGEGPLNQRQDRWRHDFEYTEPDWDGPLTPRTVSATRLSTRCPVCNGSGWRREPATRWAYFLSGFDENETRPSYFFCELVPGAKPRTVDEAVDSLKPDAVRYAESIGREVKRQGDIFAIPMPGLTLRELKQRGGVHTKRPHLVLRGTDVKYATAATAEILRTARDEGILLSWSGPRPTLLSTNHEATEIVTVGGQTYGRGMLRHVPQNRQPDHRGVKLGKDWHLIVKNTVPVSR